MYYVFIIIVLWVPVIIFSFEKIYCCVTYNILYKNKNITDVHVK